MDLENYTIQTDKLPMRVTGTTLAFKVLVNFTMKTQNTVQKIQLTIQTYRLFKTDGLTIRDSSKMMRRKGKERFY